MNTTMRTMRAVHLKNQKIPAMQMTCRRQKTLMQIRRKNPVIQTAWVNRKAERR